eukprot:TRINITY_DN306_c0_g1_i4.p1 TRINITY_DN306_c0_g1~~TRINITY_DN306_c0_g1_i4.p1  ORF type:complete len:186 (+),score=71.13 TRINITY_DN306_c0_g1_i4:117-674(+)
MCIRDRYQRRVHGDSWRTTRKMQSKRGNIMNRTAHRDLGRNNTSSEVEFDQDKKKFEMKIQRLNDIHEHRRVLFFGSESEKAQLQKEVFDDAKKQLHLKDQMKRLESERNALEELRNQQYLAKKEQEAKAAEQKKKEILCSIQRDNRELAEQNLLSQRSRKDTEKAVDKVNETKLFVNKMSYTIR